MNIEDPTQSDPQDLEDYLILKYHFIDTPIQVRYHCTGSVLSYNVHTWHFITV
jgi:hypothetical protein